MTRLVSVALPLPFQSAFTYHVPEPWPLPGRGVRVLVPFGKRQVIGLVTGPAEETPAKVKDVAEVVDEAPLCAPALLDLAAWIADHYLAPPGECYRLLLPPAGIRASRAVLRARPGPALEGEAGELLALLAKGPVRLSTVAHRLKRDPSALVARLRREGRVELEQDIDAPEFREVTWAVPTEASAELKGIAQRELMAALRERGAQRVPELLGERPARRAALHRLVELGLVRLESRREPRRPQLLGGGTSVPVEATARQQDALQPILRALDEARFEPFLLHGITGSGKTEVYFRAAERAFARGRSVLVLVPEIALTPLLVRLAVARFGDRVAVLHSELSTGERHDQWWRIRDGEVHMVIGARSALFAPLPDLGLIVVDEEHEGAYKQEEAPRYHGRDVAVKRAQLEGVPVVLGSATPSVESHQNALKGKYTRLLLPERVGPRGLPKIEVVDRRAVIKAGGDLILSPTLRTAIALRLQRREQTLVLLNRRGYATSLLCRECGEQATCANCSVSLTLHQAGRLALCHYCGYQGPPPAACPSCRGEYLRMTGYGTERVVESVVVAFPEARVDRLDRDLASRKGAVDQVLARFAAGETDILVGTQMIAKGHDFPRVTLVGVVDADVGLGLPDFRSAERTFQLLTQVAGRAGRAELPGEVILQSHLPEHYALGHACAQDYDGFFERELEFRRTMGYPPYTALVNLVLLGRELGEVAARADELAERLRAASAGRYRVLGPARAPLAKLRQDHRFQVLLKGHRPSMRDAVRRTLVDLHGTVRWPGIVVDVDPLNIM